VNNRFDEIIGQDTAKRFVSTAVKKDNLYNFLFTGPRGVGKRVFGFALAKILHCPPGSPGFTLIVPIPSKIKNKEEKIQEYTNRYLPENPVVEFEDRAAILIEQIRNLIMKLMHMPQKGSRRVVLILEADKMTDAAANCFLKTLEEPPLDTFFILTSSRPNFLLPTIRSRCRKIPFGYLSNEQIKNIIFDEEDNFLLGSPGEILALQLNDSIDYAFSILKKTPLSEKTAAAAAREYEGKKIINLLYPLLLFYRLVLYRKFNLSLNTPYEKIIKKKAESLSVKTIIETLLMLNNSINALEHNPNQLLHLFSIFSKLP